MAMAGGGRTSTCTAGTGACEPAPGVGLCMCARAAPAPQVEASETRVNVFKGKFGVNDRVQPCFVKLTDSTRTSNLQCTQPLNFPNRDTWKE